VSSFLNMHNIYFPLQTFGTITSLFFFFLHNKYWFVLIIVGGYLSVCSMILGTGKHLLSCKIENKTLFNL